MAPVYSSLLLWLIHTVSHLTLGVSKHKGNPGSLTFSKKFQYKSCLWSAHRVFKTGKRKAKRIHQGSQDSLEIVVLITGLIFFS